MRLRSVLVAEGVVVSCVDWKRPARLDVVSLCVIIRAGSRCTARANETRLPWHTAPTRPARPLSSARAEARFQLRRWQARTRATAIPRPHRSSNAAAHFLPATLQASCSASVIVTTTIAHVALLSPPSPTHAGRQVQSFQSLAFRLNLVKRSRLSAG